MRLDLFSKNFTILYTWQCTLFFIRHSTEQSSMNFHFIHETSPIKIEYYETIFRANIRKFGACEKTLLTAWLEKKKFGWNG